MVEAVIVDVDGTLMENTGLHVTAWRRAFARVGREVEVTAIMRRVGMGGDKMAPEILGEDADEALLERVRALHPEEYLDKGLIDHAQPNDGALEFLRALKARGLRVALASSASEREIERYLPYLGNGEDVDVILNSSHASSTKPDPDVIETALDRLGNPKRAVVIGDTVWDVEAAGKLGLPCVCVLSGGTEAALLVEAGAVAVYDNPADILAHLDDVLNPPVPEELALGNS